MEESTRQCFLLEADTRTVRHTVKHFTGILLPSGLKKEGITVLTITGRPGIQRVASTAVITQLDEMLRNRLRIR